MPEFSELLKAPPLPTVTYRYLPLPTVQVPEFSEMLKAQATAFQRTNQLRIDEQADAAEAAEMRRRREEHDKHVEDWDREHVSAVRETRQGHSAHGRISLRTLAALGGSTVHRGSDAG